ncbi:TraR/DksA C4-type zinc finger protein [Bythopirellula polymerisocia]|uniref:Prokaryotic dksA/traR C4-type zinc finger n=1 Tax=Bythopirellula polymerisocia TaxID=2528003 RepID=A0A5C6CUR1_9BACT|nr:TraR/DksA C4-type zinc finger protein [Bythopirellula polymerisocia]TWU28158.1 Prokaryotic dksA/traR C4-type zinc finger [Bythopirellula polymerisocia]
MFFGKALLCSQCGWRTVCGHEELASRLRKLGLFRRASNPPADLVDEVLQVNAQRLTCDSCHATGLLIVEADDASLSNRSEQDDWQQAILCEICHKPVPPERLDIFPTARRCVACQDAADRGAEPLAVEYCTKCGALLEMRVSSAGGITRYKQFCTGQPACRL